MKASSNDVARGVQSGAKVLEALTGDRCVGVCDILQEPLFKVIGVMSHCTCTLYNACSLRNINGDSFGKKGCQNNCFSV